MKMEQIKENSTLHGTTSVDGGRVADSHRHAESLETVEAMTGCHGGLRRDRAAGNGCVDGAGNKSRF